MHIYIYMCVCVCVRARARVRACERARMRVDMYLIHHQLARPVLTSPEPVLPSVPGSCRAFTATIATLGPMKSP
jgi:hypothetical protein